MLQKFWGMDWSRIIEDVVESIRTGAPVVYDDDEPESRSYLDEVDDSPIRDLHSRSTLSCHLGKQGAGC